MGSYGSCVGEHVRCRAARKLEAMRLTSSISAQNVGGDFIQKKHHLEQVSQKNLLLAVLVFIDSL